MTQSAKVVIASHRLPVQFIKGVARPSDGGLISALVDAGVAAEALWCGHLGEGVRPEDERKLRAQNFVHVPLAKALHDGFYNGYCNQVIWPGCHDRTDLIEFRESDWVCYEAANLAFAETILACSPPETPVWVHDYHLMLVPRLLKERQPRRKVLFFSHIPWPSPRVARTIPRLAAAAQALCRSDIVAFHTQACSESFRRFLDPDAAASVRAIPIGIAAEKFHGGGKILPFHKPRRDNGEQRNSFTIVGVDRFDYSKGLEFKLLAFHDFLELNPGYRGRICLRQLLIPTREEIPAYRSYQQEVLSLVAYINRKFGSSGWRPVQAAVDRLAGEELGDFYRQGDVCLVTSRKDGMNLVSLEYLAAQDPNDPGSLVVSDQAGAADFLTHSLRFRSLDPSGLLGQLKRALEMPRAERISRWQADMDWIRSNSARHWALTSLHALGVDVRASTPTPIRHASTP